jgi:hypothetical protein
MAFGKKTCWYSYEMIACFYCFAFSKVAEKEAGHLIIKIILLKIAQVNTCAYIYNHLLV